MQLPISIEASLICSLLNFFNLLCVFCECHDIVANLLTSALLELKELTLKRRSASFTKYNINLFEKNYINKICSS